MIKSSNENTIELDINPEIFSEILEYIYTKKSKTIEKYEYALLTRTVTANDCNKSAYEYYNKIETESIKALKIAAKQLGLYGLSDYIDSVKSQNRKIDGKNIYFKRTDYPEYYDVVIKCNSDSFKAHKCILAARSEYYNNMFGLRWTGGKKMIEINLPLSLKYSQMIIDYLYSCSAKEIERVYDIQQLSNILVMADQLQIIPLKEICEICLLQKLTLKNAGDILQFSGIYNCVNLKRSCFEFICLNLPAILESQTLETVDDPLLKELTLYYVDANPKFQCRIITPYESAPSDEIIKSFYGNNSGLLKEINEGTNIIKSASKKKIRIRRTTTEERHSESISTDLIFPIDNIESESKPEWTTINTPQQKLVLSRLRADALIRQESQLNESFTKLEIQNDTPESPPLNDFPELSSPKLMEAKSPPVFDVKSPPNKINFMKKKIVKVSQKQRKKLNSESGDLGEYLDNLNGKTDKVFETSAPVLKQSPWKTIVPVEESVQDDVLPIIIANEQKKRGNLVKMKAKPLHFTQVNNLYSCPRLPRKNF